MTDTTGALPERQDVGSVAERIAAEILYSSLPSHGWGFEGLDIGEINVTLDNGQRFRLTVVELGPNDD